MTTIDIASTWSWAPLRPLHYGLIHADPAWTFDTWSEAGNDRAPDYDTMTIDDIADLRVADLAAADCLLALWAVDPLLDRAFEVIEAWGFRFVTVGFYWTKTGSSDASLRPIGTGYWTRANPELCLFAVRGSPQRLDASIRKLIEAPRREHSRKPDEAYERLERLVAGPRADLFSRQRRPGWDSWGNQTDHFQGAQP